MKTTLALVAFAVPIALAGCQTIDGGLAGVADSSQFATVCKNEPYAYLAAVALTESRPVTQGRINDRTPYSEGYLCKSSR